LSYHIDLNSFFPCAKVVIFRRSGLHPLSETEN
jgi:hypothetical protein